MLLEAFMISKLRQKHKDYKDKKERYGDDNGDAKLAGTALVVWFIIVIAMFVFWIWAIVSAAKCPKPNVAEILIALFAWPIYFILKWTGVLCKGGK